MEFETLKRSHLKRNIIIGIAVVLIISAVVLTFTRAKYRVTQSIPLVNGTINYSPFDIKVSTKLLVGEEEYLELDTIPTSSNISLMSSTCTNDAILTWNSEQSRYEIANLTKKGTKCEAIYAMNNGESTDFDYTGSIQEFVAPEDGDYLLEVWGAEGGSATNGESRVGGYGGYSKGIVTLKQNDKLYVVVGGKGVDGTSTTTQTGGYNGGGNGLYHGGSGGGATHIATQTGLLSSLSNNLDSILIVAGGGGGGAYTNEGNCSDGGHGGGINGNDSTVNACYGTIGEPYNGYGTGGTQTKGGTQSANYSSSLGSGGTGVFGLGATTTMNNSMYGAGGGGGGLYGGGSSTIAGAGGGSGYIGNNLLTNKAMYCYNCTTSNDESTKTISINGSSDKPLTNTTKQNNGYAKITQINYQAYQPEFDIKIETGTNSITAIVTPDDNNLFNIKKYYYTINGEYIESENNTYTFNDLELGTYTIKVYVTDEQNLTSEVQSKEASIEKGITIDDIIANTGLGSGTPNFANTSCASGCDEATNGLYTADDNDGTTYYFRGTVDNNWVKFGGFYWRIIRINGDGSLRLIYSGSEASGPAISGDDAQIGSTVWNDSLIRAEYVGLKYTEGEQYGTSTNTTIMNNLNTWYINNLINYEKFIDVNAIFCSDRDMASDSVWSSEPSTTIRYAAYERLRNDTKPTFICKNEKNEFSKGNKILDNPIGLITLDEVVYAGSGKYAQYNSGYYLYTEQDYWTMTPTSALGAYVFFVTSMGGFNWPITHPSYGIRPVINLKSDTSFVASGTGTSTNPYIVIGAE